MTDQYSNIGVAHRRLKNFEELIDSFKKCLTKTLELEEDYLDKITWTIDNIASHYEKNKDFISAYIYYCIKKEVCETKLYKQDKEIKKCENDIERCKDNLQKEQKIDQQKLEELLNEDCRKILEKVNTKDRIIDIEKWIKNHLDNIKEACEFSFSEKVYQYFTIVQDEFSDNPFYSSNDELSPFWHMPMIGSDDITSN